MRFTTTNPDSHPANAALPLVRRLLATAEAIRGELLAALAPAGLTPVQQALLEAVAASEPRGCSQSALAALAGLSESHLSAQVERLRELGWLIRDRATDDRRRSVVRLTPAGRGLHETAQQIAQCLAEQCLSDLSDTEQTLLARLLSQIAPDRRGSAPQEVHHAA